VCLATVSNEPIRDDDQIEKDFSQDNLNKQPTGALKLISRGFSTRRSNNPNNSYALDNSNIYRNKRSNANDSLVDIDTKKPLLDDKNNKRQAAAKMVYG
jgi:hypothetical protein